MRLFKPMVSIDGGPAQKIDWGTTSLSVPAGQHEIKVVTKWYFFLPVGGAKTTVTIPQGGSASITYRAPWWTVPFISRGKLVVA
ncbi:hypothetical protein BH23ACT9_BH23ACT9_20500 [soil metagenome]